MDEHRIRFRMTGLAVGHMRTAVVDNTAQSWALHPGARMTTQREGKLTSDDINFRSLH